MKVIIRKWRWLSGEYPNFNLLMSTFLLLLLLILIMSIASDKFFTQQNILNILTQASIYMVAGVGMTLILTTSGIDISIGSMVGLITSVIGISLVNYNFPPWASVLLGLFIGSLCGLFNAFFIVNLRVPAIIVTLGTLTVFRGLAYVIAEGTIYSQFPKSYLLISRGNFLGIPLPIWIALIVFILGQYLLTSTRIGRHISAIGGNEVAAKFSGINVNRTRFIVYVIMGLLVGLVSVMLTARLNAAQAVLGQGLELHVIAVVVIGCTSLFGGRGLMIGTILGALVLGVLENGLLLARVSFFWQRVLLGMIFVIVVAIRSYTQKKE